MNMKRFLILAVGFLICAQGAYAQYELKAGNFNNLYQAPQTPPADPPPTAGQSAAVGAISGSAGPISTSANIADRYPSNTSSTIVLMQATIGGTVAAGVPRYFMGDEITPPVVQADGSTTAPANYWRTKPVLPGETIPGLGIIIPLGTVNVLSASTSSTTVVVASVPGELVIGATLLGEPVTKIVGNTVTLAGNAGSTITSSTASSITPATSFYYSPHAEKVFAHQPGRVSITWVTRVTQNGNYLTKTETFAVSNSTQRPVRTIFWTEGSFNGPKVLVNDSRITTVSPAYSNLVPKAVPDEVDIPGYSPTTPNLTTLSFDKVNGVGQLHAYNIEGRVLIEYLGNVRIGQSIYEFIGSDVVDIHRLPTVNYPSVNLGKEIIASNGDTSLLPSPVLTNVQAGTSYYGTSVRPDNTQAYYAERDTSPANDPDNGGPATPNEAFNKVVFYWLEKGDFNIQWPKFQDRYWLRWSPNLADYAHYTVDSTGSTPDTGVSFAGGSLPTLVYQDDPAQSEGKIDLTTQRFYVSFAAGADKRNRSLLKFSNSGKVWYLNLYTQAEDRQVVKNATTSGGVFIGKRLTVNTSANLYAGLPAAFYLSSNLSYAFTNIINVPDGAHIDVGWTGYTYPTWTNYFWTTASDYRFIYGYVTLWNSDTFATDSTAGLEVGMVVTGPDLGGSATITRIIDATHYQISKSINTTLASNSFTFSVQSDAAAPIASTATVGTRIAPPAGHELAGYISGGTGYYPAGYLNPNTVGVDAANKGAIIPVNAVPGNDSLTVRWFKKVAAPSADFQNIYVPGKVGHYAISYPTDTNPKIIIAKGVGTDDLPAAEAIGSVYYQNDSTKPGYNPNEEHAFALGGRTYALREDLNVTTGSGYTSQPFVLMAYTDPTDHRPAMHAYKVLRSDSTYKFDYTATAGTLLVKPYPLPLMPLPLVGSGTDLASKDIEIVGSDNPTNNTVSNDDAYKSFTFQDRKGFTWVHRGPHATNQPTLTMKLYYLSRDGFFIPGATTQPAVGTILPFLRQPGRSGTKINLANIDKDQADEPLPIIYHPVWPTNAPELRVAETLTLPKFGLPQVRGQTSAQILYQQSIADAATNTVLTKRSVTLHDPTREKTIALDAPAVALNALPSAIATTSYQGMTYFQGLPPHLQQRFYLDPLRGAKGTLVFLGQFHDEIAGEDYLDLNILSANDVDAVKGLVPVGATDKAKWETAIDALTTRVQTFKENPQQLGTYIVDPTKNVDVDGRSLAVISDTNTAVDSYALTATGQGTGFVTLVFGNGDAFTDPGDPVQIKVFKVAPQLYTGDLKVIASSNPLDEQVSLRHSGDFAGKPEDYEFDWRWTTGAATAPAVYTTVLNKRIGDPLSSSQNWIIASDLGAMLPTSTQYAAAGAAVPLPRSVIVRPLSQTDAARTAGFPGVVLKSSVGVDFSSGVPGNIVFSANVGSLDGCVLYVNGTPAAAYNAPSPQFTNTNASSGLSPNGLSKQFSISSSYFSAGPNSIEVAIYTSADTGSSSTLNFMLEAAQETDAVEALGSAWQTPSDPNGVNNNFAIIGGSAVNPFGGPQFVLNDRWFTLRYRPKASANNVLGTQWSRWMPPQFVEGWIKRVLAAINPFEQRVKDLFNNAVNTDVSLLTQAGTRWEGDIALNLNNINDVGLISIYETVLNRGKSMSIDANTNDPDTNNALILAAGYLNDLYTLLGNEAYADAANPTISIDDSGTSTQVNTSRFSFEGQVASSLDEELALLRGRDDIVSPGVTTSPAYNRLYWNYTHGINSGEAIYALNYNIKEKVGSSTANGVIDESDAQRMFPQGHGDAYGHYLTALTGYYKLLVNPNFTWTPRAEAVTILNQPVTVDFFDERKFAAAAGNVARTAQQVIALTHRQAYKDDPAAGWSQFRDSTGTNPQTGVTRQQGLDEWVSRSAQGALFNWAVANALIPEQDNVHTGIQKIDRTTVPEISELPALATSFQTSIDNANARLNPLGLSPGAISFDISPADLMAGQSQFEQVYGRATRALSNAANAFNQAAVMTGSLRNQQNSLDDYNATIVQQEAAYADQLSGIYGQPYSGDIGAGKLYAQGYTGPDLLHWFIVDRPNDLVDTSKTFTITLNEATNVSGFSINKLSDITDQFYGSTNIYGGTVTAAKTVTVKPSQWAQYNDVWKSGGLGSRASTGQLQDALQDAQQSYLELSTANVSFQKEMANLKHLQLVFGAMVQNHLDQNTELSNKQAEILDLEKLVRDLEISASVFSALGDTVFNLGDALAEAAPKVVGLASDVTSGVRGALKANGAILSSVLQAVSISTESAARYKQTTITETQQGLDKRLQELGFSLDEVQQAYEYDTAYRDVVTHANELMNLTISHQRALQNVNNVLSAGNGILAAREIFRQRAAALIQGYRTRDISFRLFRNEALEQYRSLFDLASRYSYLAAKSYDYETGLLGTTQGQSVFGKIVASRSLGDIVDGVPRLTTSSLGDGGLASMMAKLDADFSVAKGRLGINNPDQYGTIFSFRTELFRLLNDDTITSDDDAWRQTLENHIVTNVMNDADVATYCRNIKKPDGTPVPGIVIPFSTSILHGKNFFGLDLAAGDHNYTPSNFATKIYSVGIALPGYVGMDVYADGKMVAVSQGSNQPNALSATPYVYLIPCGNDYMLAPPLGDTNTLRTWKVVDQALPLPFNLGANDFNSNQFWNANGTLSEQPWIIRKHQAFRPVSDPSFFYSDVPAEFTNTRLIGRSVWNGQWKLVIPAYTLLSTEQTALDRFTASVKDIQLFLRTYSHSGN